MRIRVERRGDDFTDEQGVCHRDKVTIVMRSEAAADALVEALSTARLDDGRLPYGAMLDEDTHSPRTVVYSVDDRRGAGFARRVRPIARLVDEIASVQARLDRLLKPRSVT